MIFVGCEFAQRGCNGLNKINDVIDQFDWYLFPHKINRILPMIIIIAQQKIAIKCFGSISCDRDTFKKVSTSFEMKGNV